MTQPESDPFEPVGDGWSELIPVRGWLVERRGEAAAVYPVTLGARLPPHHYEPEPSIADRLRALADADVESAKGGTRTAKAAAKAAAAAYRLAADMIEEEDE